MSLKYAFNFILGRKKFEYFHLNYSSTHSNCCQQSLRHVGNDYTNEKDNGLQPGISKNQWQNEESHAKEDSNTRDDVDKVLNLLGYGCLRRKLRIRTTS